MTSPIIVLADRGIVQVAGADAIPFLDGMITNDLGALTAKKAVHAALLSPQGKILFTFLVVKSGDALLLDVARSSAADLVKRLNFYKLRAAVTATDLSANMAVAVSFDGKAPDVPGGVLCITDPRHAGLGYRLLMPQARVAELGPQTQSAADYHAHRVALGVPEAGRDYALGDTFPHEANFDLLNGVSFTKGCYVGQEVVSRMQNKTVVRKRIVRVLGAGLITGADVRHGAGVVGTIGSVAGDQALAMLRLDRALEAATKGPPLDVDGQLIAVDPGTLDAYKQSIANRPTSDL